MHQVAICETTSKAPSRFGRILASNELYLTERQTQKQSSQQPSAGHFPFSARVNRSHRHMTCTFEHKSRTSHIYVEACKVCARLCPGESLLGEITTNDHRRPAAAGGRMLECCQQRTTTTIHSHYIRMRRRQSHRARFAIFVTKYEAATTQHPSAEAQVFWGRKRAAQCAAHSSYYIRAQADNCIRLNLFNRDGHPINIV